MDNNGRRNSPRPGNRTARGDRRSGQETHNRSRRTEQANGARRRRAQDLRTQPRRLKSPAVLTPHQGEFAQVLQRKISPDTQLRQEAARQLATETGATVVLKANVDIIADTNRLRLNKTGNPYMTVGGTGDILTGIIGAFLSQKADPFRAAVAGAFLNGLAGDMLMKEKGPTVTPLALVDHIPRAIKYCADGPPFPPIQG